MIFYRIERKVRGEWVTVSNHGLWGNARKVLDRLQNQHGANYVRMTQRTTLGDRDMSDTDLLAPLLDERA